MPSMFMVPAHLNHPVGPYVRGSVALRVSVAFVIAAVAFVLLFGATATAQGHADEYQPGPDRIWDVVTPDEVNSDHLNSLRALVYDLEEYNGKVYAAGKFLEVRAPDGTVVSQPYVAAFDVNTGALDASFAPLLDAPALSISVVGDGTLLIGGEFTGGIVRVDAATGDIDPTFAPDVRSNGRNPAVWDMELIGNNVYFVGSFNRVRGQTRANLAKVSLPVAALDQTWAPTSQGIPDATRRSAGSSLVWAIANDPGRNRIYVAGKFDAINNDAELDNFAILSPVDGSALDGIPQSDPLYAYNHDDCAPGKATCWNIDNWYYDVQVDVANDTVWLGGQAHTTIKMRGSDLAVQKHTFANIALNDPAAGGDTQVIHVGTDTVWSGCHCWGSVKVEDPLQQIQYGDAYLAMVREFRLEEHQDARGQFGMDRITGELTPQIFDVTGQAGAWALLEDSNGRLWAGGLYRSGGGRTLSGLARFTQVGGVAVSSPASCSATNAGTAATITWTRSDDAAKYSITRSVNGGTAFWRGATNGTSFDDTLRESGVQTMIHSYAVQSIGADGSRSAPRSCSPNLNSLDGVVAVAPPTSCVAQNIGTAGTISWAASAGATHYRVYRSIDGAGPYWRAKVGTLSFEDSLRDKGMHSYTVQASGDNGQWSAHATCAPALDPADGLLAPAAPASCAASNAGQAATISWDAVPNAEYRIYRSVNGGTTFWRAKTQATTVADTLRTSGSHTYSVQARAPGGAWSASAICSPALDPQ